MNFDGLDLNLLRVFDVLMRERNVTRAAGRLGRTQSAISHSLGKLRLIFKDELFARDAGTMKPTPRAIELSADISAALASIRATIDRHRSFSPAETRRNFRIGLVDYHAMILMPGLIREFEEKAPHATLNSVPVTRAEVGSLIHSRKLDCAIIANVDRDDPDFLLTELGQDRLVCAMWNGSSVLKRPMTLETYLAATHVQISADGTAEGLADKALSERGLRRVVKATIPNYLMIPRVLRETDLIAHCGDSIVLLLNDSSEITLTLPPLSIPPVVISLMLDRQMAADPATAWLRGLIDKMVADWQFRKKAAWTNSPFVT